MSALDDLRAEQLHPRPVPRRTVDDDWRDLWDVLAQSSPAAGQAALAAIREEKLIHPPGLPALSFDPAKDLVFDYGPSLPGHANGMILKATDARR